MILVRFKNISHLMLLTFQTYHLSRMRKPSGGFQRQLAPGLNFTPRMLPPPSILSAASAFSDKTATTAHDELNERSTNPEPSKSLASPDPLSQQANQPAEGQLSSPLLHALTVFVTIQTWMWTKTALLLYHPVIPRTVHTCTGSPRMCRTARALNLAPRNLKNHSSVNSLDVGFLLQSSHGIG